MQVTGKIINHMQIPNRQWEVYYLIMGENSRFCKWILEAFAVKCFQELLEWTSI